MEMEKNYVTPKVEVLEIEVEKGVCASFGTGDQGQGGWGND